MERVESKLPCTWRRPFLCPSDHSHNNRSLFHIGWFTPKSLKFWTRSWKCSHFWFHIRSQEERWRLAGGQCTTVLYFEPNTSTVWAAHTHRPHLVTQEIRFCFQTNQMPLTNRSVLLGQEKISGRLPHILPCQAICKCQNQEDQDDLPKCIRIPVYLLMKESLKKTKKTISRHSWDCLC